MHTCVRFVSFCCGLVPCDRPIAQIPQCTSPIYHDASFCKQKCAHVCTFLLQNGASLDICVIHCGICEMSPFHSPSTSGVASLEPGKFHHRPICGSGGVGNTPHRIYSFPGIPYQPSLSDIGACPQFKDDLT